VGIGGEITQVSLTASKLYLLNKSKKELRKCASNNVMS
jgi:hypothetical protein